MIKQVPDFYNEEDGSWNLSECGSPWSEEDRYPTERLALLHALHETRVASSWRD